MPEGLLIAYLRLQSLVWAHKTPGVVSPTVEWLDRRWGEIQEIITIETSAYDPDINFQSGDFFQSVATLQSKERDRERKFSVPACDSQRLKRRGGEWKETRE